MSQPRPELICVPFALPQSFAEQLGYRGHRRFVAAYWEPLGDEVTVCDDYTSATGLGDRYAWSDFVHQRLVRAWLLEHGINLGNSDESATYWLIINRMTNEAFIATAQDGRRVIQQQRLTTIE